MQTISPLTPLPVVADAAGVLIDGYSQPGSSRNTLMVGDNAVLKIEISGTAAGPGAVGLALVSSFNIVQGLAVNQFDRGIWIQTGLGNQVVGCFIGTDVSGSTARSNRVGIAVSTALDSAPLATAIGGAYSESRNVVSGNLQSGIFLDFRPQDGSVQGNYVGVNAAGTAALPNGENGITVASGTTGTLIANNVISGNAGTGLLIAFAQDNVVQGNLIGTNATGNAAVPNRDGIELEMAVSNSIGGGSVPENVISGNARSGMRIFFQSASNIIQNNRIGTDRTAALAIGNGGDGISVLESSTNNMIGGEAFNAGNVIAFNSGSGVAIGFDRFDPCVGNSISANAIHDNGGLGIDLGGDGVTPNDLGDPDTGPNNLQNYSVLSGVTAGSGTTTIQGTLNSLANTTFRLEFFASATCDPTGYGEGARYLGTTSVPTDGRGNASFSASLPVTVAGGDRITATATDPSNNTSEFSACLTAIASTSGSTLLPDGRGVTLPLAPSGNPYRVSLVANRSYAIEVETPFTGIGTVAGGGPSPALAVTRADGTPLSTSPADRKDCAPGAADRLTLLPSDADMRGPVSIQVTDASSSGYPVRARVVETTLFCPRWSINGYFAFVNIANTSDCAASGQAVLLNDSGQFVATLPFTLSAGNATQIAIPNNLYYVFGSAYLTHDGPPGALTAGIYMTQSAGGANFRWPFFEVRSDGATDGN